MRDDMPALPVPAQVVLQIRLGADVVHAYGTPDAMTRLMNELATRSAQVGPKPVVVPLRDGRQWVVQPRAITSMGWGSDRAGGVATYRGREQARAAELVGEVHPGLDIPLGSVDKL